MASSSSVKELPPGDPKLTASIVSHLKSRGLFDKLRRDCLGDVDTKPAYLNLKQRIEGYITKFLSTQTWTPDMNKNHVRDMMRREINESGMLSAGMDHLVDQIVNPKIYQVFTPEVENGVRQYLGLSSEKDSSAQQQPAAQTDFINQPPPHQTPALPPLPPKSEFSIDETTQDVPSSCSPKAYTEAMVPDGLMDSSSEHQLMIVTGSNEHTEDIPVELPAETGESCEFCDSSAEPVDNAPIETSELSAPGPVDSLESDMQAVSQGGSADDRHVTKDVELATSLDNIKSDPLKKEATGNKFDTKDAGVVAGMTKVKTVGKDKKERKMDSGKGKESSSHSGKSDLHSKCSTSKKTSNPSKSKMQKSNKCDSRESKDLVKERDKCSVSRNKGSSREKTQKNGADATKDERGERSKGYSSQSSRSKESDIKNERKRSDDKHRHHSSSQHHDHRKGHSDRHSREKSRDRSDSRRSHGESRRDKDRSSRRDSSRQHKSSKSSEKHGESSRKERSHEKEKKQGHSKQSSSNSKDGETSQKMSSKNVLQTVSRCLFQAADDASFAEMNASASGSSQHDHADVCHDASSEMPTNVLQEISEENTSRFADQTGAKSYESMSGAFSEEISSTVSDESSHGPLQLVEAKEAEILRFSYVNDKQLGTSGTDLQLVSADTDKPADGVLLEEHKIDHEVQVENGEQARSSSHAASLELECPTVDDRHETAGGKTATETHSPKKKRPRLDASDGHDSDGAWSEVTVSSVHTSDLSSFDDCISVSSADEDDSGASREKKKIPLREIKKLTSSSNEDDDRMSRSETEHCTSDGVLPTAPSMEQAIEQREVPESAKESQPHCPKPYESSSSAKGLSNSPPPTDVSDAMAKPKMGLRRTRKINPKYVSEEFSSIFTAGKRPAGTINFSERTKYGKEKHHEERSSSRTEYRKSSREDAPEDTAPAMSCDETDQLSDTSVNDRSRRPTRRPSGGEARARSESMSSKCYQSSDLYKPRPVIKPGTRRSRPSSGGVDAAAPKKQQGLKICIGFKRGRTSSPGSSRQKRL